MKNLKDFRKIFYRVIGKLTRLSTISACAMFLLVVLSDADATPVRQWEYNDIDPKTNQEVIKIAVGTARWGQNQTINVYIQNDPVQNGTRHQSISQGIQRWANELTSRGITVKVQFGQAPDNATNPVKVVFVPPTKLKQGNSAEAIPDPDIRSRTVGGRQTATVGNMLGGRIEFANNVTGAALLGNLAMHEFGHVLGFDEERQPQNPQPNRLHDVMDHIVTPTGVMTFSPRDIAELNTLYGRPKPPSAQPQRPKANVQQGQVQQASNTGEFVYEYTVTWYDGPEIPLFQIQVHKDAGLFDVSLPNGWELEDPRLSNSFPYSQIDVRQEPKLYSIFSEFRTLSFVNPFDPLDQLNPSLTLGFSSLYAPIDALGYACEEDFVFLQAPGYLIPEPATVLLIGIGLIGFAGGRLKKWFKK